MKTLFAAAVALWAMGAQASQWKIDPEHSTASFVVKHMMVTNVHGEFHQVTGTIELDEKHPGKSTVEAKIDASTVNTGVADRDEDLRSPEFFDTKQYPEIAFKSTAVKPLGPNHYAVDGALTMHGVTRPVTLDVQLDPQTVRAPWGLLRGATATTTLDRTRWGLTWNKVIEGGGVMVSKEVRITLELELNQKG